MNDKLVKARAILQSVWGYPDFRSGQDKVINGILEDRDTLVLFPTGGGKSICYQVPALVREGCALVISPLVALMEDQVNQLKARDVRATYINSSLKHYEIEQRLVNARNGMYKLLYCSPERLHTTLFANMLPDLPISFVAVDEAHCISEWGHRFRPAYRTIRESLDQLEYRLPVIALTATATPRVEADIIENLGMEQPVVGRKGYIRENLHYWVTNTENKRGFLKKMLKRTDENTSGLVYGATRKECEQTARYMTQMGFTTEAYHAGFKSDERKAIQERWINGTSPWVVATNAFGMGIDKPDCRYVIHLHPPTSLESYYQEAGRAGRDGDASFPVLLYAESDFRFSEDMLVLNNPEWKQLDEIYQVLCDELSLGLGDEQEETMALDIEHLTKRCGKKRREVTKALDLFDSLGVVTLIENYEPELGVKFIISRDVVIDQIGRYENHLKREFVESIFRLYSGHRVETWQYLHKRSVTDAMAISYQQILKGLDVLKREQLLEYEVRDGRPVVQLNEPRQPNLPLQHDQVNLYRENQQTKLEKMKSYCETARCRNQFFSAYFGDIEPDYSCGNCDNCQKRGDGKQKDKTSKHIQEAIVSIMKRSEPVVNLNDLVLELDFADLHKVQVALQDLEQRGVITLNDETTKSYQLR